MSRWKFYSLHSTLHTFGVVMMAFGAGVDLTIRYNLGVTLADGVFLGGAILTLAIALYFRKENKEFDNFLKKS